MLDISGKTRFAHLPVEQVQYDSEQGKRILFCRLRGFDAEVSELGVKVVPAGT
jgi:hypothetical protein